MGLKKYRVHVELSKQLPQTNSLYTLCMTYIVRAATKVENPTCRAKAYHVEELP